MNKDQIKGRMKQAEGRIKEAAGKVVGDKELTDDGRQKNVIGKIQATYGDTKSDIKKSQ